MGRIFRFIAYLALFAFGIVALVFYVLVRLPLAALFRPRRQEPASAPPGPSYIPRWSHSRREYVERDKAQWLAEFDKV